MDEGKVKPGIYTITLIQEVCPCNYQVKIPPLSHQKSKYMRGIKYYADQLMILTLHIRVISMYSRWFILSCHGSLWISVLGSVTMKFRYDNPQSKAKRWGLIIRFESQTFQKVEDEERRRIYTWEILSFMVSQLCEEWEPRLW